MMKSPEESRWVSRPSGGDEPEDRVADLMRQGAPAEGLGAAARDRVWDRLDSEKGAERRERSAPPPLRLRWGVALIVLMTSSAVVGGMTARRWWPALKAPRTDGPATRAPAPARPRAHAEHRAEAVAPPEVVPPAPQAPEALAEALSAGALAAAPTASANARRWPAALATPQPELPAPPEAPALAAEAAPSALANETALLGVALARLRQQRDARGALAALDAYDARVPHGTLRREADAARVDALLMVGRDPDALALLQTLTLRSRGRDQELLVVRGELSAPISCQRSVADFDAVLAAAPPPALAERALQGRATCQARLGHKAAAMRDLAEYVRRFPKGWFAAEAQRLLHYGLSDGDL
jgi:hypothetical protein